ncbi:MAG: caspase family protein [Proteobacteria bacterium]|nr:caspase family protein [Pseudomonadota bacterium]
MTDLQSRRPAVIIDIVLDRYGAIHAQIDGARIEPIRWLEAGSNNISPFDNLEKNVMRELEIMTEGMTATKRIVEYNQNLARVGRMLGEYMFGPRYNPFWQALVEVYSRTGASDGPLTICFSTELSRLQNLPWELALWGHGRGVRVGTDDKLTFVRRSLYTNYVGSWPHRPASDELAVTLVSTSEQRSIETYREICEALNVAGLPVKGPNRDPGHSAQRIDWPPTWQGARADIFQFVGHGTLGSVFFKAPGSAGRDSSMEMTAQSLVDSLDQSYLPDLFVIFACFSFNHRDSYGFVPELLGAGAPAALGMLDVLRMGKAGPMSRRFYLHLARSGRVDIAVQCLRAEFKRLEELAWLRQNGLPPSDWFRPVLMVRDSSALDRFCHLPDPAPHDSNRDPEQLATLKKRVLAAFTPPRVTPGKSAEANLQDHVQELTGRATGSGDQPSNADEARAQLEAERMRRAVRALDADISLTDIANLADQAERADRGKRHEGNKPQPTSVAVVAPPSAQSDRITRRALLIGSQIDGLEGVHNDLEAMSRVLGQLGFEDIRQRREQEATCQGIHDGFEELINDVGPSDAVLVYYAGHGSIAASRDMAKRVTRNASRLPEFILPYDFRDSVGEFRGITSWELSRLFKRLTDKTANVAAIMDCCHSGRIVRGERARRRGSSQASEEEPRLRVRGETDCSEGIADHIEKLKKRHGIANLNAEANPLLVRLLACRTQEKASEFRADDGQWRGRLTAALTDALDEIIQEGSRLPSWQALGQFLREQVKYREWDQQTPQIEGPRSRIFASLEEENNTGVLTVGPSSGEGYILHGGTIMGVCDGDVYQVRSPFTTPENPRGDVALARVAEAGRLISKLEITEALREPIRIEYGFRAHPEQIQRWKLPVAVAAQAGDPGQLYQAIQNSLYLELVEPEQAHAAIRINGTEMWLAESDGRRWLKHSWKLDASGIKEAVVAVEQLAHGEHARRLGANHGAKNDDLVARDGLYTVSWGRVLDGEFDDGLKRQGERLSTKERYYVAARNNTQQIDIFISVYNVDMIGRVILVSRAHSTGHRVLPGKRYVLGRDTRTQRLSGVPLPWPDQVLSDVPRKEHLLVFVSSRPIDLRALETWRDLDGERLRPHRGSGQEMAPSDWCHLTAISYILHPARDEP